MKFRKIGKTDADYFRIYRGKSKGYDVENISDFNINYNDYVIIKSSNKPRIVSVNDFLEFKNVNYLFIRKDIFNLEDFNFWLNKPFSIRYLDKPFPPKSLYKKIIIMK